MSTRLTLKPYYRRYLPHIQLPDSTLFVTFRLDGSLPRSVLMELEAENQRLQAEIDLEPDPVLQAARIFEKSKRLFSKWDKALEKATDPDWLRIPEVAGIVANNLRFHDGTRYDLIAYCIMPNHVHVVFHPSLKDDGTYYSLAQIMHAMKGYTAYRANRLLGRSGAFWQHESYDHVVRDAGELDRIVAYVVNNPVKAGLVQEWQQWPWTYSRDI